MDAGKLRARVELQALTETPDPLLGQAATWNTTATVWADIKPQAGYGAGEFLSADTLRAGLAVTIAIRYRPSITPKMRAKVGSRLFEISAVINVGGRNRELQLLCVEIIG